MMNKERFDQILMEVFDLSEIDINMSRENTEKWDSMAHLTLITAVEDEFDIMMDTEDILNMKSYQDGLEILAKYNPEG